MFECGKTYSRDQLCEIMQITITKNACTKIEDKFKTYGVEYKKNGRGSSATYEILQIHALFRAYCVFDFNVPYNLDFRKFRTVVIEFLTNSDFAGWSQEMMEEYFRKKGFDISRQTISKILHRIYEIGNMQSIDFRYCLVYKERGMQTHKEITKDTYCKAWRCYFSEKERLLKIAETTEDLSQVSIIAYSNMKKQFGGSPRKYALYEASAWDEYKLTILLDYALDDLEKEGE